MTYSLLISDIVSWESGIIPTPTESDDWRDRKKHNGWIGPLGGVEDAYIADWNLRFSDGIERFDSLSDAKHQYLRKIFTLMKKLG